MKLRTRYFLYEQKRILQYIPQMLIGAIVLAFIAGAIAFCAVGNFSAQKENSKVPVALVIESDSELMDFAIDFIADMESIHEHFDFLKMTEEEATFALETGDVCAAMLLPSDVISGILDGTNHHISIMLSEHDVLSAILLQELASSGARTLSAAQAGLYAMADLYIEAGLAQELDNAYLEFDIRTLQYALVRDDLFHTRTASPTGTVPLKNYYLASGILFFLLISGIGYVRFFHHTDASQHKKLASARIGSFLTGISSYTSILFAQLISFLPLLIYILYLLITGSFTFAIFLKVLLLFFVLLLATAAYLFFLLTLAKTPSIGVTLIFTLTILLMLCSGCFIPTGLLPGALLPLRPYLPTTAMMHQLFHILSFTNGTSYQYPNLFDSYTLHLCLYATIFILLGILIPKCRRVKQ